MHLLYRLFKSNIQEDLEIGGKKCTYVAHCLFNSEQQMFRRMI